jgi:hypothetical protein
MSAPTEVKFALLRSILTFLSFLPNHCDASEHLRPRPGGSTSRLRARSMAALGERWEFRIRVGPCALSESENARLICPWSWPKRLHSQNLPLQIQRPDREGSGREHSAFFEYGKFLENGVLAVAEHDEDELQLLLGCGYKYWTEYWRTPSGHRSPGSRCDGCTWLKVFSLVE